jgi:hypothetical protein
MAFEGQQFCIPGLVSGADLSAAAVAFTFVKLSADRTVVQCNGATDIPIGVLQAPTPTSAVGQPVTVCSIGLTKLQADASLTAGNAIGTSADGQADAKTAGGDTTEYVVGQVVEVNGGTTAGNYITALINCAAPRRAA